MNACQNIISRLDPEKPLNMSEVARLAAESPAPCYYCTFEYALRMLRVLRHGKMRLRRDRRLEMWTEINEKVSRLMESTGYTLQVALAHVLASASASRFFISPATAYRLANSLIEKS